jgi:hypothetical protein
MVEGEATLRSVPILYRGALLPLYQIDTSRIIRFGEGNGHCAHRASHNASAARIAHALAVASSNIRQK